MANTYKLIVQDGILKLQTLGGTIISIEGIKDLNGGTGNVLNSLIDWRILHYSDTASNLTTSNPILKVGQIAFSTDVLYTGTDQQKFKVGNGVDTWLNLDYMPIVSESRSISTTSPLIGGGDLSADRTISTSMSTNKLIGRWSAGTGVMEEITLGTNLSLSGNTLNATGGGGSSGITVGTTTITGGTNTRIPFNDSGVYNEDSLFTWDKTNNCLSVNDIDIYTPNSSSLHIGDSNFSWSSGSVTALGKKTISSASFAGTGITVSGYYAGNLLTTGIGNVLNGDEAGSNMTTASTTTANGSQAHAYGNSGGSFYGGYRSGLWAIGSSNVLAGANTCIDPSFSASFEMAIGVSALRNVTTSPANSVVGSQGFQFLVSGSGYNLGMGADVGQTAVTSAYLTLVGSLSDVISSSLSSGIAIGHGAILRTANTAVFGGDGANGRITDSYFGNGERNAAPIGHTIHGTSGLGTDIAGATLVIAAGQGTGAGVAGVLRFATSTVTTTGTTLQTLTNRAEMTSTFFRSMTGGGFNMYFVAGNATIPTYSFVNDTNTGIYSDTADTIRFTTGGTLRTSISTVATLHTLRNELSKGSDVASANDLTLGTGGNTFVITGTTQINAITTTNWQAGSEINLIFSGVVTVKHNTAGGANTARLFLAGSLDLVTANNTLICFVYDGTQWQEKCRKVA